MNKIAFSLLHLFVCGLSIVLALEEQETFDIAVSKFVSGNVKLDLVMEAFPTERKCALLPKVIFQNDERILTCVSYDELLAALDEANRGALTNAWSAHGLFRVRKIDRGYEMKIEPKEEIVLVLSKDMAMKIAHDIRAMSEIAKMNPRSPPSSGDTNSRGHSLSRESNNAEGSPARNGEPSDDNRRSAPRQPPEDPPPAKPGSTPR
ncbi:MAG: hypothetical protein WCK77_23990 [Verrucomicrobiota bacterium]